MRKNSSPSLVADADIVSKFLDEETHEVVVLIHVGEIVVLLVKREKPVCKLSGRPLKKRRKVLGRGLSPGQYQIQIFAILETSFFIQTHCLLSERNEENQSNEAEETSLHDTV